MVRDALAERVAGGRLDNVSVRLGEPADPKLPPNSFDRVLMVHMYHELQQPYEFLWRLRPSLAATGEVIVVDADRVPPTPGMPPKLLECEFAAVGHQLVEILQIPSAGGHAPATRHAGRSTRRPGAQPS